MQKNLNTKEFRSINPGFLENKHFVGWDERHLDLNLQEQTKFPL